MADQITTLKTTIQLRYGTENEWRLSQVILKQGEVGICFFTNNSNIGNLAINTPVGIKVGDGYHRFVELPWIQGLAADVYDWAKEPDKPSYSVDEISGLTTLLENTYHLDPETNIAPRIYEILEEINQQDKTHKYYLRYKETNDGGDWVTDTTHPIDLSTYMSLVNWIGSNLLTKYSSLGTFTSTQTGRILEGLTNDDEAVENEFVTLAKQTNGMVEVNRARPTFQNIEGTAPVNKGGTGRDTLTTDNVLVGNGTNAVKLIPIAEEIDDSNNLVPSNLIKAYVDNSVAGLTGAMHFVGEATVEIEENSTTDPDIDTYDFDNALPGDVILYNEKEFVWTGEYWNLLGDEGSYAIKGSIVDGDIAINANIAQSKIAGLTTKIEEIEESLDNKVTIINGKTLSTNDLTNELLQKIQSSQENAIEHILLNGVEIQPKTIDLLEKAVNINLDAASQENVIETIIYDGVTLVPDNKTITITPEKHPEYENNILAIQVNNHTFYPNEDKIVEITINQQLLQLDVLAGATIPDGSGGRTNVTQQQNKLQLERIAVTGNVKDLIQSENEYITIYCGDSRNVM